MSPSHSATDQLLRILSGRLERSAVSGQRSAVDPRPPTPAWAEVADVAVRHSLAPLLYKRLKQSDAWAPIPADVRERLRLAYYVSARRNKRLYQELGPVLRCLRGSGIPVVVLKGAYLAEAVYGDVALRPMCDVDLLVPEEEMQEAQATISGIGFVSGKPEDTTLPPRIHKHLPALVKGDLAVEVHWTIAPDSMPSAMRPDNLWDRVRPTTVAGEDVLALSPEDLLLHLCLHFGYQHHLAGLKFFCDIAETIHHFRGAMDSEVRHRTTETTENLGVRSEPRSSSNSVSSVASVVDSISVPGIDWQQVVERAREWGAARHVDLTLHLARSLLDAEVPDDVLEQLAPGGLDQRLLDTARESVLTETGYGPWMPILQLQGARSFGDKVKLLWKRIFLSRDKMAEAYPASCKSRHLHRYYVLRLRDVIRAYWAHTLRRGLPVVRSRGQDRNVALVNWLRSGKPVRKAKVKAEAKAEEETQ